MKTLLKQITNLILILFSLRSFAGHGYVELNDIGGVGGSPISLAGLIGIAHGIPILAVAFLSKKKWALLLTTALMIFIAFAVGKSIYVGYDLFFIVIASALGWFFIANEVKPYNPNYQLPKIEKPPKAEQAPSSEQNPTHQSMELANGFILIISIIAIGIFYFSKSGNKNYETQPKHIQETRNANPPISKPIEVAPKVIQTKIVKPSKNKDIRNCLSLNSNAEIARCASNQ